MVSGSSSRMNVGTVLLLSFHSPLNLVGPSFPRITVAQISVVWARSSHGVIKCTPQSEYHLLQVIRVAEMGKLSCINCRKVGTVFRQEILMSNVCWWEASEGS